MLGLGIGEFPAFPALRRAAEPESPESPLLGTGLRWLSVLPLLLIATLAPN